MSLFLPDKGDLYHCPHCKRTLRAVVGPKWIEIEFCHDDGGTSLIKSWACPACQVTLVESETSAREAQASL